MCCTPDHKPKLSTTLHWCITVSICTCWRLLSTNFKRKNEYMKTEKLSRENGTANGVNTLLAFRYFFSKIKVQFKAAAYVNCFKIIPTIQITYSGYKIETGFAIEFTRGKWGIGWRFYNER